MRFLKVNQRGAGMDYKRATRRSEISLRCPCRTHDGLPLEIELLDLSQRGCRARGIADVLHVGQALRLFPEGCEAVAAAGGRFAVQDEASSAVWGMPGAAVKTGLVEKILPLDGIAPFIAQVAETGL